jgi:hypothetical protein
MVDQNPNLAVLVGEHADKILALYQAGFFGMRNGSMTVHFGQDGKIRKFEVHQVINVIEAQVS